MLKCPIEDHRWTFFYGGPLHGAVLETNINDWSGELEYHWPTEYHHVSIRGPWFVDTIYCWTRYVVSGDRWLLLAIKSDVGHPNPCGELAVQVGDVESQEGLMQARIRLSDWGRPADDMSDIEVCSVLWRVACTESMKKSKSESMLNWEAFRSFDKSRLR